MVVLLSRPFGIWCMMQQRLVTIFQKRLVAVFYVGVVFSFSHRLTLSHSLSLFQISLTFLFIVQLYRHFDASHFRISSILKVSYCCHFDNDDCYLCAELKFYCVAGGVCFFHVRDSACCSRSCYLNLWFTIDGGLMLLHTIYNLTFFLLPRVL